MIDSRDCFFLSSNFCHAENLNQTVKDIYEQPESSTTDEKR